MAVEVEEEFLTTTTSMEPGRQPGQLIVAVGGLDSTSPSSSLLSPSDEESETPLGACMEKLMALAPPREPPLEREGMATRHRSPCPPLRRATGRVPAVEAVRIEYDGLGLRPRRSAGAAGPPAPAPAPPPFPFSSS